MIKILSGMKFILNKVNASEKEFNIKIGNTLLYYL